ncbi:MAG: hypothetical protein AAF587_12705 [Bacteroidota bacterium]
MSNKYSVHQLGTQAETYIRKIQEANNNYQKYYGQQHITWLEKAIPDVNNGLRIAFGAFVNDRLSYQYSALHSLEIVGSVITNRVPNPEQTVELKSFMVNKKAIKSIGHALYPELDGEEMKSFVKGERFQIRKEIFREVEKYCKKNKLKLIEVEVPKKNKKLIADMEDLGFEIEEELIYPHYSPQAPMQKFQKAIGW